ncbi:GA module-containing protein [Weissella viridescens]|nr:GA module-containing protein [Weissella viridescens]
MRLTKVKNAQNLQDAKDDAKQQVDQLPNLTPDQKRVFKDHIGGATLMTAVQAIVGEAPQLNDGHAKSNQQAQLPNAAVNAQSDMGVLGGAMLGLLTLFGLGKRRKREEEK